jgi:integrase
VGCIRKTKTGLNQIDFRDQHGRRYRKSFDRQKNAEKKLREIQGEVEDRSFIAPKGIPTFRAIGDDWLRSELVGHDTSSISSWNTHLTTHLFPLIGDLRIDRIDVRQIETGIRDVLATTLSAKTVNKVLTTGSAVFKMAVRHNKARANPFHAAERSKFETDEDAPISEVEVYTPDENRKLTANAAPGIARAFLTLVSRAGARASEALALRWPEIDLEAGAVTIRKAISRWKLPKALAGDKPQERFRLKGTKRRASVRTIPLTPETALELKRWKLACPPTKAGCSPRTTASPPGRTRCYTHGSTLLRRRRASASST